MSLIEKLLKDIPQTIFVELQRLFFTLFKFGEAISSSMDWL